MPHQSTRSDCTGSARAARSAGMTLAASVTISRGDDARKRRDDADRVGRPANGSARREPDVAPDVAEQAASQQLRVREPVPDPSAVQPDADRRHPEDAKPGSVVAQVPIDVFHTALDTSKRL